ncbi:5-hydroxytryptamine receptor 3A-like [Bufo gargarizans]|uniref:5-hydroxytryptamine receptor 3A-like n=1 Tax=Bufo gargarizans TaxID=30331 RepID=UPI001CF53E31|nr:5-hydroxytryptamine receptor 3A-like [Bufo gargarizans]
MHPTSQLWHIKIILKRKPQFYIVNLILPSMLLMVMNIVGFYIPPEKGERTSFKITLLLGYSVFLLIVAEASPPIGTPLIGSYFGMGMVLIVLSVMESIFISHLVHQQELNRAVPKWVKTLVLEKMATVLCLKNNDSFITSCNDASSDVSEQKENSSTEKLANYNDGNMKHDGQLSTTQDSEVLLRVLKEIVSFRECLKKNTNQCDAREWLHVGYIIDKFLFRIYVLIIVVYMASMIVIWAQ